MYNIRLPFISGILMVGVFIVNVYIGLYDSNLATYNPVHYDLNWVIAVVDIIVACLLFLQSKNLKLVTLSGIIWPIVYLTSLGGDVATSLCLGTPANPNCWPTSYDAFKYLILGQASEGWALWPFTIPTAITLLVIVIILSIISVRKLGQSKKAAKSVPMNPDGTKSA